MLRRCSCDQHPSPSPPHPFNFLFGVLPGVLGFSRLPQRLDWLSFLEALGHVARFKPLPNASDLAAANFRDVPALLDALLDGSANGGGGGGSGGSGGSVGDGGGSSGSSSNGGALAETWSAWLESRAKGGRPDAFPQRLEHVIKFMFHMLERRGQ
jgi:hypothetical protein